MKKILISMLGILIIGVVILAVTKEKETDDIQIRTDVEPIYNHFPGLPETENIQWCSRTSSGIGLTTVWVYVFAFYDHDVSDEFSGEGIFYEKTDLYFLPENITDNNTKWRKLEEMGEVFQSGINDSRRMYADVYLNEAGNIIYIEAAGD